MYQRIHDHIEGKGIDLFLARTKMDMMRGKVEVTSNPMSEAIFCLCFNKQKEQAFKKSRTNAISISSF